MGRTSIEWTGETWNPVTGCTKVSPACDHCYAERITHRFGGDFSQVKLHEDRLEHPLRWRKPRLVFVNSMSDLFHPDIPDRFIARVFAVMHDADAHTFQILTKRHARMRSLLNSQDFYELLVGELAWQRRAWQGYGNPHATWPLGNVWLGVSVENQKWADIRIPALLSTPATVRFLSCEPLLGPIDLTQVSYRDGGGTHLDVLHGLHGVPNSWQGPGKHVDWVIAGGESGPKPRPMHPGWPRVLLHQCQEAGVPFHFKQWGEYVPETQNPNALSIRTAKTALYVDMDGSTRPANRGARGNAATVQHVGKRAAGRHLDGRTWDETPETHQQHNP